MAHIIEFIFFLKEKNYKHYKSFYTICQIDLCHPVCAYIVLFNLMISSWSPGPQGVRLNAIADDAYTMACVGRCPARMTRFVFMQIKIMYKITRLQSFVSSSENASEKCISIYITNACAGLQA